MPEQRLQTTRRTISRIKVLAATQIVIMTPNILNGCDLHCQFCLLSSSSIDSRSARSISSSSAAVIE